MILRILSDLPFTPSLPDTESSRFPRVGTLLLIGFFLIVFWALFVEGVRLAIHGLG